MREHKTVFLQDEVGRKKMGCIDKDVNLLVLPC